MRLYKLQETVLRIAPGAANALGGICSNTLDAPKNAFLDKQGRIIATVAQRQVSDDEQLLAVTDSALEALKTHLEKMLFFSDAKVEPIAMSVYLDLDAADAQRVFTTDILPTEADAAAFDNYRLDRVMPLQGVDYGNEMLLNLNDESYVSYTKGCFVGQEIVARVHHKSRPPRKLVVLSESEVPEELRSTMTSVRLHPTTGVRRGFVFVSNK